MSGAVSLLMKIAAHHSHHQKPPRLHRPVIIPDVRAMCCQPITDSKNHNAPGTMAGALPQKCRECSLSTLYNTLPANGSNQKQMNPVRSRCIAL